MTVKSYSDSIAYLVNDMAAAQPAPGGGAAAAAVAALGIALVIKTANFTIGKKKYRRNEKEAKAILKAADKLKDKLIRLIEKDITSYKSYSKTKSKTAMRSATACVAEIAKLSREGLIFCGKLGKIGNVNFKGDLDAAKMFLISSAKSAENLVKLNQQSTGT